MSCSVLVLGGTAWLGGEVARSAHRRGHQVTALARGASGDVPAEVTWVRADRSAPTAYDEVAGQDWDVVVDVSRQPDHVRSALDALAERTRHWAFVSTASVYAEDSTPDTDESAPLHPAHVGTGEVDASVYGPAKVACEEAVLAELGPDRALVARAGLIGGYGDRSDRLGYWSARIDRAVDGEAVLVPPLAAPFQVIDVLDLADWLVEAGTSQVAGVFNANGDVTSIGAVLEACLASSGRSPLLVEASDDWLVAHEVEPWMGPESLALWLPQSDYAGFMTRRNAAARSSGLALRPLEETVAQTLAWERELGLDRERRAGLSPEREAALLAALGSPAR